LKGTFTNCLILTPSNELYPDADFASLQNQDDKNNPRCVCSCTGYVICIFDCQVILISKLQTEIALLTIKAEYAALSALRCGLFPLIDLTREIYPALLLTPPNTAQMHIKIHEITLVPLSLYNLNCDK
jgi:hypothetical protein